MKLVIDIPEILLDRIKSAKCVPDMYGSDIVNTVVCVRDATPYKERPHGEWIFKNGKYRCTACGEKAIYRYSDMSNIPKEILTDFCPNCGADMRKERGGKAE